MARIGSALLALMLAFMMCGTTFAAGKKENGKTSKGSKKGKSHKKG